MPSVAGASPDKQLLSHPLALDSPASDDAHSAAHLTSSEPSRASSFTSPAPTQVPSTSAGIPVSATASDAVPNDASLVLGKANAPTAVAQQFAVASYQQQLQPSATQLLPSVSSQQAQSEASNSLLHGPILQWPGGAAAHSLAMQLPEEAPAHSPAPQLPEEAGLADPVHGDSPARNEYDPERYRPKAFSTEAAHSIATQHEHQNDAQAQPFDAQPLSTQLSADTHAPSNEPPLASVEGHQGQTFESQNQTQLTQSQSQTETDAQTRSQTQLVGQSPKQAALHRLRSLTVKQSQTIKAFSTSEAPLLPLQATPKLTTHPSISATHPSNLAPHPSAMAPASAVMAQLEPPAALGKAKLGPNSVIEGQVQALSQQHDGLLQGKHRAAGAFQPVAEGQTGHDAEAQRAEAAFGHLIERQMSREVEGKVSSKPTIGEGTKATQQQLLSPRRSTSVAKLRSQSLAKHLQDPRYVSMRRLPLVPITGPGTDASQQSIPGSAGRHVTPEGTEDATGDFRRSSLAAKSLTEQLDKPPRQAVAESGGCHLTPPVTPHVTLPEAEQARRASKSCSPTAGAELAADRADTGQPCPTDKEAAAVDLADINVVLDTECSTRSPALESTVPKDPQADPSLGPPPPLHLVARSAESLGSQLCSHPATVEPPHQPHQSSSRAESTSPPSMRGSSDSSHGLDHHPHTQQHSLSSACFHHADHSSMVENTKGQSSSGDCAVALYIRSSGTGATVSLKVQELSAQDSLAESSADITHPVVSSASKEGADAAMAVSQTGLFPAAAEGQGQAGARPASSSLMCQAVVADDCRREEEDSIVQQATVLTEGQDSSATSPEATVKREPRADSSSPGENEQRAVSSSPRRRGSPGQGLLGRLEGGLRSWLGRGSKQMVGPHILLVEC